MEPIPDTVNKAKNTRLYMSGAYKKKSLAIMLLNEHSKKMTSQKASSGTRDKS